MNQNQTVKKDTNVNYLSEIIRMLISIMEVKGVHIKPHSETVATHCLKFSKSLKLSQKESEAIYLAALLHDIGMVYIPDTIIQKPDRLTDEEMQQVRQHPLFSEKVLGNLSLLRGMGVLPIVRHHHEEYNGMGYPDGLKDVEIPIGARIISLVDSYFAMATERSYRPPMPHDKVIQEMKKQTGKRFDGNLLLKFIEYIHGTTAKQPDKAQIEPEPKTSIWDIVKAIVETIRQGKVDLPVLPKVIHEVQQTVSDPEATIDQLTQIIEKDPIVSAKLISVVNSPIYRGRSKFTTVKEAITRLGVKETQNIVLALGSKAFYKTKNLQFMSLIERLWLHSLACAYGAKKIAETLKLKDAEGYFLMGLIHDIGKILLVRKLSEVYSSNNSIDMNEISQAIHEAHCSIGGVILRNWKFSQNYVRVATLHEGPRYYPQTEKQVLVVNLANNICRNIGYSLFEENVNLAELDSAKMLNLNEDMIIQIISDVQEIMKSSQSF
jgi:HD-GYP domain-containing protein (c-di-GMP phosphodiesterase class II)